MDTNEAQQKSGIEAELTDEQLAAAGLVRKMAYVKEKQKSGNAKRVEKHREKQRAEGVKQMNIVAPAGARDAIKLIADRTRSGEDLGQVLASLLPAQPERPVEPQERTVEAVPTVTVPQPLTSEQRRLLELGERVGRTKGLRGVLLAMLLAR